MISIDVIEREINELEARGETTYNQCERLAWLYIVRDHIIGKPREETERLSGSEFLEAASGIDYRSLMGIMDEHMEALRVVMPKQYEAVMERIRTIV